MRPESLGRYDDLATCKDPRHSTWLECSSEKQEMAIVIVSHVTDVRSIEVLVKKCFSQCAHVIYATFDNTIGPSAPFSEDLRSRASPTQRSWP